MSATQNPRNQAVIVTGAARGIGRAIALRFALEGARVAAVDILADELAELCACETALSRIVAVEADISTPEGAREATNRALEALGGHVDVIVNNAGIEHRAPIASHEADAWRRVMAINLDAPFFIVQTALPALLAADAPAIVNIASTARIGFFGQPAYDTSKGGLVTLTRSMANELGREGVRVNAVAPGFIATNMVADDPKITAIGEKQVRLQPLQRMGKPEEVAAAVVWLASSNASYITGQTLHVDGGWVRI